MRCSLQDVAHSSAAKLAVLFYSAFCWAVAALVYMRTAALYLLNHTIPLHGSITIQVIWCLRWLEGEGQCFVQSQAAGVEDYIHHPRGVLEFVRAALLEVEAYSSNCRQPSHAVTARKKGCHTASAIER